MEKRKFSANDTLLIKGVAIILMVCNHLYPTLDWIYPQNMYFSLPFAGKTVAAYIGGFGKLCVAMYTFLTGIGMFYTYSKLQLLGGYKHTIKKLLRIYLSYWSIVIIVFIPTMIFVGVFKWDAYDLLLNLLCVRTSYVIVAWYLLLHCLITVTFPIYLVLMKNNKQRFKNSILNPWLFGELIFLFIMNFILNTWLIQLEQIDAISTYFTYMPIVLIGYYVAEKNIFVKLVEFSSEKWKINKLRLGIIYLVVCIGICLARGVLKNFIYINMDTIYAPMFVYCMWEILNILYLKQIFNSLLGLLGQYSTEIWFLHAIFFIGNAYVQSIGYWPRISILILIWVLIMLMPIAMLFQKIDDKIFNYLLKKSLVFRKIYAIKFRMI